MKTVPVLPEHATIIPHLKTSFFPPSIQLLFFLGSRRKNAGEGKHLPKVQET